MSCGTIKITNNKLQTKIKLPLSLQETKLRSILAARQYTKHTHQPGSSPLLLIIYLQN